MAKIHGGLYIIVNPKMKERATDHSRSEQQADSGVEAQGSGKPNEAGHEGNHEYNNGDSRREEVDET